MTLSKPTQKGSGGLLGRILETPDLVALVQSLDPRVLYRLVKQVGLEDAGEIITLASTEQIERIFDDDLWHSKRIGRDETFDPERFGLWLQMLLEAGEEFAARRLTELDPDIVTLGFCRLVLVVDVDQLAVAMADPGDDERMLDKVLESSLYHEFDQYQVIARRSEVWDAVLSILVALDTNHHDFLDQLLDRCCHISSGIIENQGGLFDVLSADETVEGDAAATREGRRAQEGFIAPSDAVSFLALARATDREEGLKAEEYDPVTRAYFRSYVPSAPRPAFTSVARAADRERWVQLLADAQIGVNLHATPMLNDGKNDHPSMRQTALIQAMDWLVVNDASLHLERRKEFNYLANVLVAGQAYQGRRLRPIEAADIVLGVIALGWEVLAPKGDPPARTLSAHSFVKAFRCGWRCLHDDAATAKNLDQEISALIAARTNLSRGQR